MHDGEELRPQTAALLAPGRLGPYRLLEEIGSGAMGTVYLAYEPDEDRRVALKVLHPHLVKKKGFFQRFHREALAGQCVRHPGVVHTLDCSFHLIRRQPYCVLVMEYVPGRTLRSLLRDVDCLPEAQAREIGCQVAEGLGAIHAADLVHRDIKPENLLVTQGHRIRIMDLGVARHTKVRTALTLEGQFAGSLLYAAPEQFADGTRVGPAADLYGLGVVLYELVSGMNPFRRDEPREVMDAHLGLVPRPLDRRPPVASPFFAGVVGTLLEKHPQDRFPSAAELACVLAEGEASTWWQARGRVTRRRTFRSRAGRRCAWDGPAPGREASVVPKHREIAEASESVAPDRAERVEGHGGEA